MKRVHTILHHDMAQNRPGEEGFSLVVVLFFLGLIASIISMNAANQKGAVQRDQARTAGWHLAQVAKAARIYVRDRSLEEADPYYKGNLAAGGLEIALTDIRSAGLLPPNFPDTNILGQSVRVYAANFPVNGDPNDAATVANAYVYLESTEETRRQPSLMQYVVEGAKQHGLFVEAPIFSADGSSLGDDCDGNGEADVVLWDTNCLDQSEFTTISAQASFTPGGLMVPAWRSENHDTRAVMRYPQPENPGYATMMTALEMATPYRDAATGECTQYVQIYDYNNADPTAMMDSTLCDVDNDVGSTLADDRRFDLVNVSGMQVQSIVAANQGPSEATMRYDASDNPVMQNEYAGIDNTGGQRTFVENSPHTEVMFVGGRLDTGSNVWATGREINPTSGAGYEATVTFADTSGVATGLAVDNNVRVGNGTGLDMRVSNISNVGLANSEILDNDRPGSTGTTVSGLTGASSINTASMSVSGDCGGEECGMVALDTNVGSGSGSINAEEADFFTTVNTTNATVGGTRGDGVPGLVVLKAQGGATTTTEEMTIGGTLAVDGNTSIGSTTSIQDCFGFGCPNITQDPQDGMDYGL